MPLATSAPDAEPSDQFATVTRTADADANGCEVTQYLVRVNGGVEQPLPANGVIAGLVNGTNYAFSVAGVNEIGTGEFSLPSQAVVPFGVPGPPTVSATRPGNDTFEITFGGSFDNGSPVLGYQFSGPAEVVGADLRFVTVRCTNNLGNACIPQVASQQQPRTPCLQNAQTVRIEGWATNEAGEGERVAWTENLNGCPPTPGINNVSAGDGEYTVGWTRPAGSTIWVESNGTIMGPFNDNQNPRSFPGANGTPFSVQIWACNQFGCSTSGTQNVSPRAPAPSVSVEWGEQLAVAADCNPNICCLLYTSPSPRDS